MKKLFYLLILLFVVACQSDGSGSDGSSFQGGDGTGGSLARFTLAGDFLYTVDDQALKVFDVSQVDNPSLVNDLFVGIDIETIFTFEEHLYIGSRLGMFIYDISDPAFPLRLSEVQHLRSCDPVVSNGDFTYVTLHTNESCFGTINQLEIYNTVDKLRPQLLTIVQLERPIGLALRGDVLYVTDKDVVRIFDVSNPEQPDLIGGIPKDVFDLILLDNRMYLIGENELTQYAVNENDPTIVTELSTIEF